MRKNTRKVLILGIASLITIPLWTLSSWHKVKRDDEVHRRNLQRDGDLYFRLRDLEHLLGGDVAKLVGVQALESKYEQKTDTERAALLASGYFVKVSATVTNLGRRTEEINERLRHIDGDPESLTIFSTQSNNVTVICRPVYAPGYRVELLKR